MNKTSIDTKLLESKMILNGFNSRKAFAEALGVSSHTISNLLNGVHKPGHDLMVAIYNKLKLTPQEGTEIFFNKNLRVTKVSEEEIAK